jgi:hypothetical protein
VKSNHQANLQEFVGLLNVLRNAENQTRKIMKSHDNVCLGKCGNISKWLL